VVDVAMPILNGLEGGRRAKEILPSVKLVYLTMNQDPEVVAEAFRRGASGYLPKTCAAGEIVSAIRQVLLGKLYFSPTLPPEIIRFIERDAKRVVKKTKLLTPRQEEVLQLLAEGKVMKEVGVILHMATRTVAYHKYRMMKALGTKTHAELIRYAIRHHITSLDISNRPNQINPSAILTSRKPNRRGCMELGFH
jgi:DNA-binding NarL/FixJ family response regulator